MKRKLPPKTQEIEDSEFGVDYLYKEISIDQKFSFGDLGKNTIKIRTRKRRLLNKSDWTMIINQDEELEFFETKKLAEFVKKNWDLVQKRTLKKKQNYNTHAILLDELYSYEGFAPIKSEMLKEDIISTLDDLTNQVLDYSHKICLLNCLI